jgi:hypothetical protein
MYNVLYSTMWCTVQCIITLYNVGNVLLCVIYQLINRAVLLHEYHVIHRVRYYPQVHVIAVGRGKYYPWIRGHYCTFLQSKVIQDQIGDTRSTRGN